MSEATLCGLCRSVPFFDLPDTPETKGHARLGGVTQNPVRYFLDEYKSDITARPGFPYHRDIEALACSARDCDLCKLISSEVVGWTERYNEAYRNNGNDIQSYVEDGFFMFPSGQQLWLTRRLTGGDGFIVLAEDPGEYCGEKAYYILAGVGFCVSSGPPTPDSPLASHLLSRPIERYSGSQESLDVALTWLNRCVSAHEQCSSPEENIMPTRVLDVGTSEDDGIKLVATEGAFGSWTALSHCWGGKVFLTTTTHNVASHMGGISMNSLPQTFRDAIVITRRMGCRYCWIDSLCICQDDADDWAREAAMMSEVYSNARLVIAADHASNGSEGCFSNRADRRAIKMHIPTPYGGSETVDAVPLNAGREAFGPFDLEWEAEPLNGRAWVLQERLLAQRTLHYCTDQMFFECNEGLSGEDGSTADKKFLQSLTEIKRGLIQSNESSGSAYQKHWNEIMLKFRRRSLTYRSDALPSLSGIAKLFSKRGAEYVAGLWSDALVEGLSWRSSPTNRSIEMEKEDNTDGSKALYIAPSWSWASFEGFASTALNQPWQGTTWKSIAVVEEYHCDLKTSNPFGEVTDGWVRITGPMIPATLSVGTSGDGDVNAARRDIRASVPSAKEMMAHIDHPAQFASEALQPTDLTLLVLGGNEGKRIQYFCLILALSGDATKKMKRVGWCVGNSSCLGRDIEKHTMTVVLI